MKLLEHISKDLGRQTQLPNKEGFEELQSEVAQKERGLVPPPPIILFFWFPSALSRSLVAPYDMSGPQIP